jgi:hypothetical protein
MADGYREAGGRLEPTGPEVFATWMAKNAQWLTLQARRALGLAPASEPQRRAARAAVGNLLVEFRRAGERAPQWLDWTGC